MPLFGQSKTPSLEEILARMREANPQSSFQMGPDGLTGGPPAGQPPMDTGNPQISPEQYQMLMQSGRIPPSPGAGQPGPNPQFTPEDLERLRNGALPRSRAPAPTNPFMRPL